MSEPILREATLVRARKEPMLVQIVVDQYK